MISDKMTPGLEELFNAAWTAALDRTDKLSGARLQPVPPAGPGDAGPDAGPSPHLPVLRSYRAAISLAKSSKLRNLAVLLDRVFHKLVWSQNPSYVEQGVNPDFLKGYAFAVLSGPDGPIIRDAPTCGFILLAPDLHYPGHQHAPREIYMPLTPGARWRLEDGDWFDVADGDLILHDSWIIHATRTRDEPFLAFVAWLDPSERGAVNWAET